MVRHWLRTASRRAGGGGWRSTRSAPLLTFVVLVIVVTEKFSGGAFVVVILIPLLVGMMLFIHRQYAQSARQLAIRDGLRRAAADREERVDRPVPGSTAPSSRPSTSPARSPSDVTAVFITDDPEAAAELRERWERQVPGVPLVIVESPYRALVGPLVAYLDVLDRAWPPDKPAPITFVVMPEYVARSWWERILYNQSAQAPAHACCSAGRTRSSSACPTGATTRPLERESPTRRRRRRRRRRGVDEADERRPPTGTGLSRWYRDARDGRRGPPALRARSSQAGGSCSWPNRRHHSSGAPSWRCPVAAPTGRSSPSPPSWRTSGQAELVGVHVVEIDWTLPLDADVAGRPRTPSACSTSPRRPPRPASYKLETVLLQARDVGAALVDEATERGADLSSSGLPVSHAIRRRLRHRAHDPVRPEERPVRGLGRPRADARGASMKTVIVGCGRVGAALAEALDRDGHDVLVIDISTVGLRPAAGRLQGEGASAATAPTRTSCAVRAPRAPTCSSP